METMRKISTYTALALAILAGVSSCNKRSIGQVDADKYPVQFSAREFGNNVKAVTKVTDEGFEQGDVIGIYSYPTGGAMFGTGEFNRGNVPYVQMETNELLVQSGLEPLYFPADPELPLAFRAYYPYSDLMTSDGVLAVDIADQTRGETNAILYSANAQSIKRTANYVSLEFGYVVAQVVLNIKYDPVAVPDGDVAAVTAVTLAGDGLFTAYDFHVVDGSVTMSGNAAARGAIGMQPGVATAKITVVPGAVNNLEVSVVTPAHTYVGRPQNITYEVGKTYTYNMTLKGGGEVQMGEATIVDWEPGNNGGEVIPANPE